MKSINIKLNENWETFLWSGHFGERMWNWKWRENGSFATENLKGDKDEIGVVNEKGQRGGKDDVKMIISKNILGMERKQKRKKERNRSNYLSPDDNTFFSLFFLVATKINN